MMPNQYELEQLTQKRAPSPFRRAVVRGLGILLPPLLTIVIFIWVGNTVVTHLLEPMEGAARWVLVEEFADIRTGEQIKELPNDKGIVLIDETPYKQVDGGRFIPLSVYTEVLNGIGGNNMPVSAKGIYELYYDQTWLRHELVVPLFLCLFILVLYLLGKFLAAGIGNFFWSQLERLIHRVPLVRNVYGSVKQVTDFFFTQPDIQYTRVVAIEYPRRGMWQLAFVTGEGIPDLRMLTDEPIVSVFIPHSPIPLTGFSANVKKSETVELSITVDQALQYIVSCGVVAPATLLPSPSERPMELEVPVGSNG